MTSRFSPNIGKIATSLYKIISGVSQTHLISNLGLGRRIGLYRPLFLELFWPLTRHFGPLEPIRIFKTGAGFVPNWGQTEHKDCTEKVHSSWPYLIQHCSAPARHFDSRELFWIFQTWAVLVPRGAKTEHKGCFSTSGAITAPIFSAVFWKVKLKPSQISLRKLIEKTHLFE